MAVRSLSIVSALAATWAVALGTIGLSRKLRVWLFPRRLPAPVNSALSEFFPTVTRDGTLYFTQDGDGGASALYRARPTADGGYAEPERLPEAVNSVAAQFNGWIDPDDRDGRGRARPLHEPDPGAVG